MNQSNFKNGCIDNEDFFEIISDYGNSERYYEIDQIFTIVMYT